MIRPETFTLNVDGIGEFVFFRRTIERHIRIQAETIRLTGGDSVLDDDMRVVTNAFATLTVLINRPPAGWSMEEADPFDPASYERVIAVWRALREHEEAERAKRKESAEAH